MRCFFFAQTRATTNQSLIFGDLNSFELNLNPILKKNIPDKNANKENQIQTNLENSENPKTSEILYSDNIFSQIYKTKDIIIKTSQSQSIFFDKNANLSSAPL